MTLIEFQFMGMGEAAVKKFLKQMGKFKEIKYLVILRIIVSFL